MVEAADGEKDQGGQIPVPVKGVPPPARGYFLNFIWLYIDLIYYILF